MYIQKIIVLLLMSIGAFVSMGSTPADTAKIYFRKAMRYYDPSLDNNRATMDRILSMIRTEAADDAIDSIVIRGYASPDGRVKYNRRLADERGKVVAKYIVKETGIDSSYVIVKPGEIAWDQLREMIASAENLPGKEMLLDIIDNTPEYTEDAQGRVIENRKRVLFRYDDGKPYSWLLENCFPKLRNGVTILFYIKTVNIGQLDYDEISDTPYGRVIDDTAQEAASPVEAEMTENTSGQALFTDNTEPVHRFALKNNFLYDGALAPNLEFEWMINDRYSLSVEWIMPWWKNTAKMKYYQLATGSVEFRRWINPRAPWHGMFAGVFAGGGWYDLENGRSGNRGEGGYAGLSFGYMWPVSRCISFESSLGVGYLSSRYKVYRPFDGHFLYQRTKQLNYFGPLKLKFSIVWRFYDINKKNK